MSANEENLGFLEPLFTKALEARQSGDNNRAIELFQNILRIEPRLPEPHLELAHIYLGLNQFETAKIHSEQAIEYLIMKDCPQHVWRNWNEGNKPKMVICRKEQLPSTREWRNAWKITEELSVTELAA